MEHAQRQHLLRYISSFLYKKKSSNPLEEKIKKKNLEEALKPQLQKPHARFRHVADTNLKATQSPLLLPPRSLVSHPWRARRRWLGQRRKQQCRRAGREAGDESQVSD